MRARFIFLLSFVLLQVTSVGFAKSKHPRHAVVKWVKRDVVYFKVSKLYVGGTIGVYNDQGKLLEADKLPHTHTMIYFDKAPEGRYTIRVRKGNMSIELELTKIQMNEALAKKAKNF